MGSRGVPMLSTHARSSVPYGGFVTAALLVLSMACGRTPLGADDGTDDLGLLEATQAPALDVYPASLDFGTVSVGTVSAVATLTFTNSVATDVVISDVTLNQRFDWAPETATTCVVGAANAPGSTCTMAISFAPQNSGSFTG